MALFNWKKKTPQDYMIAGNYKAAVKGFKEKLKIGFDPGVAMQLANCQMKIGETKDAKKVFLRVGTFYGDQGFFNKAVAAFKKALTISPDDQGILDKLAEYHGKVPSYMIDDRILQRASGFFQAPDLHEIGAAEPAMEAASAETPAEAQQETTAAIETHGEPEDAKPQGISAEVPPTESGPDDDPLGDFDSFSGLDDLHEELTAEFTFEEETPPINAAPMDEMNFGDREPVDEIDFGSAGDSVGEDLEDTGDFQRAAEAAATMTGIDRSQITKGIDSAAVDEPETASQPEADSSPPQPAKPDSQTKERVSGGMVFSTQTTNKESADEKEPMNSMFNSFDDALDSLFTAEETTPQVLPSDPDQDQRHWTLFRTMDRKVFLDFVIALESRDFDPGQLIVAQGDEGQEMYLVADGIVDVEIGGNVVATLGEGDFFGEAGLLTRSPRTASCRAKGFTSCLVLTREHLVNLSKSHASIMDSIRSIYYTRMEQNAARNK